MTDAEKITQIDCENTKLQIVSVIAKILYTAYGEEPPCNFNDNADYMGTNCEDYCMNCDKHNDIKCWEAWLKSKLKEEKISVCDEPIIIEEDFH